MLYLCKLKMNLALKNLKISNLKDFIYTGNSIHKLKS